MNNVELSDEPRLTVERLRVTYLVAREHPDPEGLRVRLDAAAHDRLPEICARLISQGLPAQDPSVWLIRKLNVDLTLDAGAFNDDQIARAWGRQVATGIARTVAGLDGANHEPDGILHFENRAEYLARFAADLAAGRAWGQWYYHSFESLRSLPTAAALREALTREPQWTKATLLELRAHGELPQVLAQLTSTDALRVLDACTAGNTARVARGSRELVDAFVSVLDRAGLEGESATPANALRLYLTLLTFAPRLATDGRARGAVEQLLAFLGVLEPLANTRRLLGYVASGDLQRAIHECVDGGVRDNLSSVPFFAQLANGDAAWLEEIARARRRGNMNAVSKRVNATGRVFASPFAGVFLLIGILSRSGLNNFIRNTCYPKMEGMDIEAVLRFLVVCRAMGVNDPLSLVDPAIALAVGLDGAPDPAQVRAWANQMTAEQHYAVWTRLIETLTPGQMQGRSLLAEVVSIPTSERVLLLRDRAHDAWAYAEVISTGTDANAALARGLDIIERGTGTAVEQLELGTGLDAAHDARNLQARVKSIAAATEPFVSAARELASLVPDASSPLLTGVSEFELVWTLAARATLRAFVERLMGFRASSPEYIRRNFLEGNGTIQVLDESIHVQLAARPLNLVLSLAGINGQRYVLPWRNETSVTIELMG